jgi:putative peptide zinc metalloprotease protein
MSVDRPTFHEAWYRVSDLHPRLLSSVRVFRQQFRGQLWHVIENRANNQYARLSEDAYAFVGLLDGKRTVAEVWQICNEQYGDRAPTQGEVIQILGQLYGSNLLYVDLPPDSEALFKRYHKRLQRQVQSTLMNLLFVRFPLLDPDRILNAWVGVLGLAFTWVGLVLWLGLVGTGSFSWQATLTNCLFKVTMSWRRGI